MAREPSILHVELDWDDQVGFIRRTLPVAFACPDCGCKGYKRIDTKARCKHVLYFPVECIRCSFWRAVPKAPASSSATVAAARPRSLRAKVKRFFVDVLRGGRS